MQLVVIRHPHCTMEVDPQAVVNLQIVRIPGFFVFVVVRDPRLAPFNLDARSFKFPAVCERDEASSMWMFLASTCDLSATTVTVS